MAEGGCCSCSCRLSRLPISFDVKITLAVVVISTLALVGDWTTNPVDDCSDASLHGPWARGRRLQAAPPPPPPPPPYDPYAQQPGAGGAGGTYAPVAPQPGPAPAPAPAPGAPGPAPYYGPPSPSQWALAQAYEDNAGCGLNAWVFTCYPHAFYSQFSMAFLPRLFVWSFGHTSFEEYKVNMLFLLVLGAEAEKQLGAFHMFHLLLATTFIGGMFVLCVSAPSPRLRPARDSFPTRAGRSPGRL